MITLVLSASVLMDDAETKVEHDADAVSAVIGKPSFKDSYKYLNRINANDNAIRYIPYILSIVCESSCYHCFIIFSTYATLTNEQH